MQKKSNKKSSYFRKRGGKCRITFLFLKKGGKSIHLVECARKKDMVYKNTFMHLKCVAYNQDELLIKNLGF